MRWFPQDIVLCLALVALPLCQVVAQSGDAASPSAGASLNTPNGVAATSAPNSTPSANSTPGPDSVIAPDMNFNPDAAAPPDAFVTPAPTPTPDPKAYVLLETISVAKGRGVFVVPAGSSVVLVSKDDSGLIVQANDGFTFMVTALQLTQDPAKIAVLKKQIAAAKAAAEAKHNAEVAAAAAAANAELARQEKFSNTVAAITPTPTPSPTPTALTGSALDETPVSTSAVSKKKK